MRDRNTYRPIVGCLRSSKLHAMVQCSRVWLGGARALDLLINKSKIRLATAAFSDAIMDKLFTHTHTHVCASVTKQCNLVQANYYNNNYYYYQSTDLSDTVTRTMQGHFTESQ